MAAHEHRLLEGLTAEQRDAVTTRASPLCVIAGAGSGKTRVLTRRIAWQAAEGHLDPRRVLTVTFTRRAARELRSRLRRLGLRDSVKAGTFHAVALAQLHRHAADSGRRPPRILENTAGLVAEMRPRSDRTTVATISHEIGWCQARLIPPERYAAAARQAGRRPPLGGAARFAQMYADYESAKLKRRILDFDDVLGRALELMRPESKFAAAHRWFHQHLLVDEFQDINPLQFALLKSWLGPDSTLVVVGDPDQAIYGWNGADPELINSVGGHLSGCAVLHMRTNFRSTPEVLAAAGRILGRPPQPAARPPGDEVAVTACDGADEAATLARAVRQSHRPGSSWRRQAVLARTNAQIELLRKALARQGIPVSTHTERALIRRPEVEAVLRAWPPGASLGDCVADTRQDLLRDTASEDPTDRLKHAADGRDRLSATVGSPADADAGARANIVAFLDFAEDHLLLHPDSTVGAFVTALRADDRVAARSDGVDMLTFHGAKGLEWPIVHLVGVEDGFVPIAHARTEAARAEERRLLHVAVTRAEQRLHVMWCPRRDLSRESVDRKPSPWLADIGGAAGADEDSQSAINRDGLARARQALKDARDD